MDKKMKASFTIEAVFIMPIVLYTMVCIIYLSFYLHDYCKIQGITDMVLHKAVMNLKYSADIETGKVNYDEINKGIFNRIFEKSDLLERDIESYLGKSLSKGLIAISISNIHVSKGLGKISVRVEGRLKIPLKGVQGMISSNGNLIIEAKASNHYPADSIRISEVILDTGSKIKGFEKLKEKLGGLIP